MSPHSLLHALLLFACVSACGDTTPTAESTSGGETHQAQRPQAPAGTVDPSAPPATSETSAREDATALTTPEQGSDLPAGESATPTTETSPAPTEAQQASPDNATGSASPSGEPETRQPILAPARAGRIPRRRVQRVLRSHHGEVATCYQQGLEQDPNLQGEVHVRFLVGPNGQVDDAEVFHSTLGSEAVHRCITTAIRSWSFPRPTPRGRSVLLSYPFVLATE